MREKRMPGGGESWQERRDRRRKRVQERKRPNKEASCVYCGEIIARPHTIGISRTTGFQGGACSCGAIYLLDENGFHGGEAIVELLTLLYGDWETAWKHIPGEDYDEASVHYDERNHRIADPDDIAKPESVLYFAWKRRRDDPGQDPGGASPGPAGA